MGKKVVKKRKIKYFSVFLLLLVIALIIYIIMNLFKVNISNIYVSGNSYLKDQEIIEIALIDNYPSTLKNSSSVIKKRLENNIYIKSVDVKKFLTEVYIKIEENRPLFYDESKNKTVLMDKQVTDDKFDIPILINYVPDTIYDDFVKKMRDINSEVLGRISEIKYDPNDVDDSRFYITMSDGNFVYLTLNKFSNINDYIDIVKKFGNKKGTLYLDDGEYFEVKN